MCYGTPYGSNRSYGSICEILVPALILAAAVITAVRAVLTAGVNMAGIIAVTWC